VEEHRERRLEIISTVLLALATVATAWSAYQARQWTGEQALASSRATAARISVNRTSALANRQVNIDVATFIAWIDARAQHHNGLAHFYQLRFRDEFKPAFNAWVATKPFENPQAPPTPFAMKQYKLAASTEADRIDALAALGSNQAKDGNQRANNYMLAVVLFASVLFFAGISTKMKSEGSRTTLVALGCVLFLATAIWVATFPAQLTT
jgi:hypothetical protein